MNTPPNAYSPSEDPHTQFWAARINRAFPAPKHWWTAPHTRLGDRSPQIAAMQGDIKAVEELIAEQENALANVTALAPAGGKSPTKPQDD
jgi:hypothetical protein